ncbi:hypothetical protein [Planotetraspora mira]
MTAMKGLGAPGALGTRVRAPSANDVSPRADQRRTECKSDINDNSQQYTRYLVNVINKATTGVQKRLIVV